jgi:hypothetical protein
MMAWVDAGHSPDSLSLPKLMAMEQLRKQQRRRTTWDFRGPIRWERPGGTKIRTASDDFEHS